MQKIASLLLLSAVLLLSSCSKETTTEPDLSSKIVGVYQLSKISKGTTTVNGATGSVEITALDKTKVSIKRNLRLTNSTQNITLDYVVEADGANYTIKDGNGVNKVGSVVGNKFTMTFADFSLGGSGNFTAEFTK
jgi:hypothetical protein